MVGIIVPVTLFFLVFLGVSCSSFKMNSLLYQAISKQTHREILPRSPLKLLKHPKLLDQFCQRVSNMDQAELWIKAQCGASYPKSILSDVNTTAWKVVLYGPTYMKESNLDFKGLGCNRGCQFYPSCNIQASVHPESLKDANVILISQNTYEWLNRTEVVNSHAIKVLVWREAVHTSVPIEYQKYAAFRMGCHLDSAIVNPMFFHTPLRLLPPPKKTATSNKFGIWMTSHGQHDVPSYRMEYMEEVTASLLEKNLTIDRFGACFNRSIGRHYMDSVQELVEQYKFMFAIENTIQDGYVSEKLFYPLTMNVLPVYYGALDAPNITRKKSFIRASDYSSPQELVEYLAYLDSNPKEYEKYFEWKDDPIEEKFEDSYLELIQRVISMTVSFGEPTKEVGFTQAGSYMDRRCNPVDLRSPLKMNMPWLSSGEF